MNKKNFNNRIIVITGLVIVFLSFYFRDSFPDKRHPVVAEIRNQKIEHIQYREFISGAPPSMTADDKRKSLDYLVNQEIIKIYGKKSGIVDAEILPELKINRDFAYNSLLIKEMYMSLIKDVAKVSKEAVKKEFAAHKYISVSFLAVDHTQEKAMLTAQKAKTLLENGVAFDKVMVQYASSAYHDKNFLGHYRLDKPAIDEPFTTYVMSLLSVDNHSEIFTTDYGWVILHRSPDPEFKEAAAEIYTQLISQTKANKKDEILSDHQKQVRVNDTVVKKLADGQAIAADEIIVSVNAAPIAMNEFQQFLDISKQTLPSDDNQIKALINEFGMRRAMLASAYKLGIKTSKRLLLAWEKQLKKIKISEGPLIIEKILALEQIEVSIDEMMDYYTRFPEEFHQPELLQLQVIQLKNKKTALQVYRQLSEGADFEKTLTEQSIAPNVNMTRGTEAFFSRADNTRLYDAVTGLDDKEFSQPVRMTDGYGIYRVRGRIPGGKESFETAQDKVHTTILVDKMDAFIERIKSTYQLEVKKYYDRL